ncbi:unnamed protein product, partial [Brassica rapa]
MVSGSDITANVTTAGVLKTDHGSIYDYSSQKEPRVLSNAGNYMRHNSRTSSAKNFLRQAPLLLRRHNRLWPPRTNTNVQPAKNSSA